jgi:hypothetical protein
VLNVKTSPQSEYKRDATMDPTCSSLDWKLNYLRQIANFL